MKKLLDALLSGCFFLGWSAFYIVEAYALGKILISGCLVAHKPNESVLLHLMAHILFVLASCCFVKKTYRKVLHGQTLAQLKIVCGSFLFLFFFFLLRLFLLNICDILHMTCQRCF